MKLSPINLEVILAKEQSKAIDQDSLLRAVKKILEEDSNKELLITKNLNQVNGPKNNAFDFNLLDTHKIFHIDTVKNICIDYRLRFLDSQYFKPEFPYEAICKIKELEKLHSIEVRGFKIMAPSKLMKLKNADDPLLFAPIGNGYYYLIHKWGNDLHPFRKLAYLPFKNINNTLVFAILLSLFITFLIPKSVYDAENAHSQFWFLFLFIFKAVGFVIIFYGVSLGKNFNAQIWNSKYYNS